MTIQFPNFPISQFPIHRSLPIVIVGHVDHGKSTLIGRLLYDTGSLPPEKIEEIRRASEATGREMEFSFAMDHLEEERQRGITIDISQTFFTTEITELFSQLITRPISPPAAVPVPQFPNSPISQSPNLLSYIIPISARYGSNVATRDDRLKWFDGPTVLEALDSFETPEIEGKPLRFPVQDVYPINGKKVIVGRIEAGQINRGEGLRILPEGETASVVSIEKFQEEGLTIARTGECIGLCLDKPAVRGNILVSDTMISPLVTQSIRANIFWMSDKPYHKGEAITFKCATQEVEGKIGNIYRRFDPDLPFNLLGGTFKRS